MRILIVISLFFSIACSNSLKQDKVPFEKMRGLMLDIMKADEYYIRISLKDTLQQLTNENFRLYDQLFRSYGVTKEQFYTTYKYYEAHPAEFRILIDSIDASIVRERNRSYNRYTQPK